MIDMEHTRGLTYIVYCWYVMDAFIFWQATAVSVDIFVMFKWIKIFLLLIAHHLFDLWSLAICVERCALCTLRLCYILCDARCYCFIDEMCEWRCQSSSLSPWICLEMFPLLNSFIQKQRLFTIFQTLLLFNFMNNWNQPKFWDE